MLHRLCIGCAGRWYLFLLFTEAGTEDSKARLRSVRAASTRVSDFHLFNTTGWDAMSDHSVQNTVVGSDAVLDSGLQVASEDRGQVDHGKHVVSATESVLVSSDTVPGYITGKFSRQGCVSGP